MASVNEMREAGFSSQEVSDHIIKMTGTYKNAGFSQDEINKHFGVKPESKVKTIGRELGDYLLGTAETAMSLSSSALLFAPSKAYGVMALPWGADVSKQAEESIAGLAYKPYTKSGKAATEIVGKGMEKFLYPARKVGEALEPISPRLAYLAETATEFGEFGLVPFARGKVKAGVEKVKTIGKSTKEGAKVMDLIRQRRASIDTAFLDSESFIRKIENDLSKPELDAVPFIRQGIKDPKVLKEIGREDLISVVENPSPKLLKATEKIGKYYDEAYDFLRKHWDDVSFVEDYVTHLWDIPKARKSEVVNHFATQNPFTKKRTIPTLEEGIKLGLKPKTTNIAELLRIYDQYKIKTAFNMEFAKQLKSMKDVDGNPLMLRDDKAPIDWVTVEATALKRAMAIGKVGKEGVMLTKVPVKVHPEIAKEVNIIFDKPFSHAAITAYETVNAFAKKTMLTASLFHHFALTESAFSTGIGKKAISMWNPFKLIREMRTGNYEIFQKMPLAKDAINHGVTFGALSDIQRGRIQNALMTAERKTKGIPGLKQATKGLRKANEIWDAQLWDYYHNTLKLYAYEQNLQSGLKLAQKSARKNFNRDLSIEEIKQVKQEMASFVNDSFGGQNWELSKTLGNPKIRQMLHWGFLAPDWTISVLKQGVSPVKGAMLAKTAGAELRGKALTKQSALFWAKAGLYYNLVAQSVNYYKTKKEYGEGRFTWDNAPGHELNIFAGRNDDGTERYIRMGKQFREVMEWGIEPQKKFGAKLTPVLREGIRQLAQHDPGSGYPTEWAEEEFWSKKGMKERVKSIAEMPLPFSIRPYVESRPRNFMFTLPASKGMTNYKTVKLFKQALKDSSLHKVKRVFVSALQNNLDAQALFKSAKSAVKADVTYNNKKLALDIRREMKSVPEEAQIDILKVYRDRGILTPEVVFQLDKIFKKEDRVRTQKKALNIQGEQP